MSPFLYEKPKSFTQRLYNLLNGSSINLMKILGMFPFKYNPVTRNFENEGFFVKFWTILCHCCLLVTCLYMVKMMEDPSLAFTLVITSKERYMVFLSIIQSCVFFFLNCHIFYLYIFKCGTLLRTLQKFFILKREIEKWKFDCKSDLKYLRLVTSNCVFNIVMLLVCYFSVLIDVKGIIWRLGFLYQIYSFMVVTTVFFAGYLYLAYCLEILNKRLKIYSQQIDDIYSKIIKSAELIKICCELSDKIDVVARVQLSIYDLKNEVMQIYQLSLAPTLLTMLIVHITQLVELFQSAEAHFDYHLETMVSIMLSLVILLAQELQLYYFCSGPERVLKKVIYLVKI